MMAWNDLFYKLSISVCKKLPANLVYVISPSLGDSTLIHYFFPQDPRLAWPSIPWRHGTWGTTSDKGRYICKWIRGPLCGLSSGWSSGTEGSCHSLQQLQPHSLHSLESMTRTLSPGWMTVKQPSTTSANFLFLPCSTKFLISVRICW